MGRVSHVVNNYSSVFPECRVKVDHVQLTEEPELTPYETRLREFLAFVETANHAKLDEMNNELRRIPSRGRRPKLNERRAALKHFLEIRIKKQREAVVHRAKIDAFIGPITTQQHNGHPF